METTRTSGLRLEQLAVGTLDAVDLSVNGGEIVCISGASGSGKSRFLRAIADLDPHEGRVFLEGEARETMTGHDWRRQVMMVPADSQWWFELVGEHFGNEFTVDLAGALGFPPEVRHWSVSRLSSGERQRLALLRALSRHPKALLLDEPTANLDDDMTRRVEDWLVTEIRERQLAVIWVAHDIAQIRRVADRHYRINHTALEPADGSH